MEKAPEKTAKTKKPTKATKAKAPRKPSASGATPSSVSPPHPQTSNPFDLTHSILAGAAQAGEASAAGAEPPPAEEIDLDEPGLGKWARLSEKHAGGRPTDYEPVYCAYVVEMGRVGYGRAEIAAELNVVRNTLENWEERHPEFLSAMQRARELSLVWWSRQGQRGIWGGKEFNANAYSLQVRNRFPDDWQERSSKAITGADGGPVETRTEVVGLGLDFSAIRARREKLNGQG